MPDILSHVYCADFARRNFETSSVMRQIIDRHIDAFYLGSQGPDFLYYFRIWPWKNDLSVPSMATTIHQSKTAEFLNTAFKSLKSADLGNDAGQIPLAYWMGFLCHYALDSQAHPYIYYFSGIHKDENSKKNGDTHNHKFLENIIDTLLSEKHKNVLDLPKNQYACLPKRPGSLKAAYKSVSDTFYAVYGDELKPEIIQESVTDMRKLIGLMHDPKRRMRKVFAKVEQLIAKPRYITTAAFPATSGEDIDYLNLRNEMWVHPCDENITYNDSFLDLFDKSVSYATELMQYAWDDYKDTTGQFNLEAFLGNYSYDTGLKCDNPCQLQFSDSVFKR